MYHKQWIGAVLKAAETSSWVQWRHHSQGKTHCEECLKLDGCWFRKEKAPPCPHHPFCHCTLEPIDYAFVLANASAHSVYSKFDPYLFNTTGRYSHGKEKLFKLWGYSTDDIPWLKAEMERQALEKYLAGDYKLNKLDKNGQRINIRIVIVRRSNGIAVTFISGWMARPDGQLQLTIPYGDE